MTYHEALQYLDSFINYEKKDSYDYKRSFKLDRMRKVVSMLGDPQKNIKSIHVAGTKGKGSTAAFIYNILKKAGFKTGLYTSPHLVSFRERIIINDEMINEEDVARIIEESINPVVDAMAEDKPTFFEIYTALAYVYFKEKKVDFAVYEVGLGGRLDATNVIEPLACAITPISYDHMDKLGNTLADIAYEKAGIIKDNVLCISAPQEKEAEDVIRRVCREKNSKLIMVGREIKYEELAPDGEKEVFNVDTEFNRYENITSGLLGRHQIMNAATSIGAAEALMEKGIKISANDIKSGIGSTRWLGRMEVASRDPLVILDGAQNKASAKALADAVTKKFKYKKLVLVLGVSKDKDVFGILEELLPISDSLVLTKSNIAERALEPSKLKEFIDFEDNYLSLTSNVKEAIEKARSISGKEDLILITGSLFVVGEARSMIVKS